MLSDRYIIGRNIILVIGFSTLMFVSGCEPDNQPPTAKLEVDPLTAEVPAQVRMKVTGEDPDGAGDIKEYVLFIGSESVTSKTPIDITRTFQDEGKIQIYGKVTDSENQSNNTPEKSLELTFTEAIEQSVSLVNDVQVSYTATLKKVQGATLTVNRNGSFLTEEQITDSSPSGVDYQKTFTYTNDGFTKGNYEFVLESDNLENKKTLTIPNYKPTANFSSIVIDMEQDGEISVTLGNISDKNPEDVDLATYTNARSVDGKTSVELSGNTLRINGLPNQTGTYQVEVEYGSTEGGLEKSVLRGDITPHTWKFYVNPFVQPNDTTKPIIWNNLTLSERVAHFEDRLYNYDKTDEIENPDWVCSSYVTAWIIAFNGYPMEGLENNNWHNIPAYDVTLRIFNKPSHAMGAVNLGVSVGDIKNWRFIETQNDSTFSPDQIKEWGTYEIEINYTYVVETETQGKVLSSLPLFEFILNNNGEWVDSGYRHPDIHLIERKED